MVPPPEPSPRPDPRFEPSPALEQTWLRRQARRVLGDRLRTVVDSQDLAQEVQVLALEHARRARFAARRGFRGWLLAVLRNRAASLGRRRQPGPSDVDWEALAADGSSPSLGLKRQESAAEVRRRLGSLSERDREVVRLRVVEDLPWAEVAARIGIGEGHARVIFDRSAAKLARGREPEDG